MRAASLLVLSVMGIAIVFVTPIVTRGQPGGGGKKGGFGGGGFDAGSLFDRIANKRPSIPISELKWGKNEALQYAQDKGITNGMINRQQYIEFNEQLMAKFKAGGGKGGGGSQSGGGASGGFPGGGKKGKGGGDFGGPSSLSPPATLTTPGAPALTTAAPPSADVINQLADASFKRLDANGDGKLTPEELPGKLRFALAKWDKNGDGLIDLLEYREYFAFQFAGGGNEDQGNRGIASIIIEEEELDRKQVVYRAGGKMPAGLPSWFKELDKDEDGQVGLYEWRRGGKDIDEFPDWDLNNDGYITPDECLRYLARNRSASNSTSGDGSNSSSSERPQMNGRGGGTGERPAFDFSKFGKGGGGKGKKGGGGQ